MSGQEDYVLVPREPTDIMVVRGDERAIEVLKDHTFALKEPTLASRVYSAMLSAAPASPQPQGAGEINAGSVETPSSTLGLSAEACQRSGAAGFDTLTSENLGEYKYQEPANASVLGPTAHPQPSGDGLSDETLREMLAQQMAQHIPSGGAHYVVRDPSKDNLIPIQTYTAQVLAFARAVEARVRSTPTDEWRRAVEACARVASAWGPFVHAQWKAGKIDRREYAANFAAAAVIARKIRALSPTKPDDGWRGVKPKTDAWMIVYEDADRAPLTFTGEGAEEAAHKTFARALTNWNCHLFQTIGLNPAPPHTKEGE